MNVHDFVAQRATGEEQSLRDYEGNVLLIVNTASKCGFTPQYDGLQKLYEAHQDQKFQILAFPCNQFGHQEPGSNDEIVEFCQLNYQVSFPIFAKVDVNGQTAHPLYKYLTEHAPGLLGTEAIKWNFTKFLVDGSGHVVKRYAPTATPQSLDVDIEVLLGK